VHPLIRLRLKITAAERAAAHARKLGREDIAEGFERAAILYRASLRMGRSVLALGPTARTPESAVPVPERD
jgi:hypothetical protein